MKKVLFSLMLLVSFGVASLARAADATLDVGSVKDRTTNTVGSIVRIAAHEGPVAVGLESQAIGRTGASIRNQADAYYGFDMFGVSVAAGFGGVTQTGVNTHAVYLGKVGYKYDFTKELSGQVGLAYRNDFDDLIRDRQALAKVGVGYAFDANTAITGSYSRSYGDSKLNTYSLSVARKF